MKKTGFTLAEVLITLSIIGVVAMMTLPALMTNVQEQQAKTGLKKGLNTVIEAAQMNRAVEGFDYSNLATTATGEDDQSISGLLKQRTQYDPSKSTIDGTTNGAAATAVRGGTGTGVTNHVVFFRDGSALSYPTNAPSGTGYQVLQGDGLPAGFTVVYDINGEKAPNILSNCLGRTTGGMANDNGTCDKSHRVIKDQFTIRLRGSFAEPWGAAARWAFEH